MSADQSTASLASYLVYRIDQTASTLGSRDSEYGPRTRNWSYWLFPCAQRSFWEGAVLRNTGARNDPHPADIVRGFLAAATVRQLKFSDVSSWADTIEAGNPEADLTTIVLAGVKIDPKAAKSRPKSCLRSSSPIPWPALKTMRLAKSKTGAMKTEEIVQALQFRPQYHQPTVSGSGNRRRRCTPGSGSHDIGAWPWRKHLNLFPRIWTC